MFLWSAPMLINLFSSRGWESWGLEHRPLIPEQMPVLIDEDLRFEDGPGAPRPVVVVNRWLRELPASGAPAASTWQAYARIVRDWMEFLVGRGAGVFASRQVLKSALSGYAEYRAAGPLERRLAASTWNQHVSVLASFYRWAVAEGHAQAEPFTYRAARGMLAAAGRGREVRVNAATRRRPKPHVTIKYLEPDFTRLFLDALAGLGPGGRADAGFAGRELARNHAIGQLAVATGLRLQEFTFLLVYEIPPLPRARTGAPVAFPVPAGVTKGRKARTTWISYDALVAVHQYLALDRAATADGSAWSPRPAWGEALPVTCPDAAGGRIGGARRRWDALTPSERRRLVAPGGGSYNGSCYADVSLQRTCAVLGMKLIHSQPGRPLGRGKVERVIETIQQQFMVEVTGDERHPARHPVSSLEELNGLLDAWVRTVYHARVHSETGETPQARYDAAGPAAVPDPARLRHAFSWSAVRLVRKTATVDLEGNTYSVDPFLVGRKVELVFDPFDMTELTVYWQGRKAGRAVPQVIGRHAHPKAPPDEDDPEPRS